MVSVSTNAQGQYSFPRDRLAPGAYDITMRAVAYTLKPTTATIESDGSTQLDPKVGIAVPPSRIGSMALRQYEIRTAGANLLYQHRRFTTVRTA
jgi:hypothetical protein